jgi:hypothetical protein
VQTHRLDELISNQLDCSKLVQALELVKSRPTAGSLASYDELDFTESYRFVQIFRHLNETVIGNEPFPGQMLSPKKERVSLPENIYGLLVQYYNNAYDGKFVTIAGAVSETSTEDLTIVLPYVNQYGRIRIGSEIFGATIAPRYMRNSHILAKFIQSDETTDVFPGEVQYYFEHSLDLPIGKITHHLAFVKWHLPAPDRQTRFHCKSNVEDGLCNIELWKDEFYSIDRDSIIPVHNIYSRFVPSEFIVGVRKPKKYMAVIPINRQFHL